MLPPEPELTPDLEWMLQSIQVSEALMVETIVQEHGAELYRLAQALCDRPGQAWLCLADALVQAAVSRREYLPGLSPRLWLAGILVAACRRRMNWSRPVISYPYALWRPKSLRRPRRSAQPPAGTAQLPWQVDLWMALNLFTDEFRLPVLLHYLHDLAPVEIAALLGDDYARTCLATARSWLVETLPESEQSRADALIAQELKRRWLLPESNHPELQQAVERATSRFRHNRHPFIHLGGLQQAGLLALMAVFVIVASWLTTRLAQSAPRTSPSRVVVTQVVEVIRRVTPTPRPSPTPIPQPVALGITANEASLRQRMADARSLWSSIWVDVLLVDYGPVGYIGPARSYRSQMWVQNPTEFNPTERRLVVSGTTNRPGDAIFQVGSDVYEIDLPTGLSSQYTPLEAFALLRNPHQVQDMSPNRWMIYSAIHNGSAQPRLLFRHGWAQTDGRLVGVFIDRLLGRDALVVDRFVDDQLTERFWLDAVTGIALRWERYAGGGDRTVIEEMQVLNLELEAPFPAGAVTSSYFWRQPVTWEGISAGEPVRSGGPPPKGLNTRRRISFALPPDEAVDLAKASLTMQWVDPGLPGWNPAGATDLYVRVYNGLYAWIYYLGRVQLGNPWNMACRRSPDGMRIAFTSYAQGATGNLFAQAGPFWLDLRDAGQVTNALPGADVVSGDFAFSPDSSRLAFWGCAGGRGDCSIYIHDLESGETRRLASLGWGATHFQWSPGGHQLALMGLSSTLQNAGGLVIDADSGELLDSATIRWPELSMPGDSPVIDWGTPFWLLPGLDGCLGAPEG